MMYKFIKNDQVKMQSTLNFKEELEALGYKLEEKKAENKKKEDK